MIDYPKHIRQNSWLSLVNIPLISSVEHGTYGAEIIWHLC